MTCVRHIHSVRIWYIYLVVATMLRVTSVRCRFVISSKRFFFSSLFVFRENEQNSQILRSRIARTCAPTAERRRRITLYVPAWTRKYKGLFRNGRRVVVSEIVLLCRAIYETPGRERERETQTVFGRRP